MAHSLWLMVCVLTSVPGVLYSTVHAVPGFLSMSGQWHWIVSSTVSLCAGLLTSFALPKLAELMRLMSSDQVDRATLQQVGQLLASILLPGLVTFLCHAKCLGAWTTLWEPCRKAMLVLGVMRTHHKATPGIDADNCFNLAFELVSARDLCSLRWWHMDRRDCMEAVMERLAWFLYSKFAHSCFTVTALRVLRVWLMGRKRMTQKDASLMLSYTWLVVTLFGPCLPILNALAALLVKIYSVLLFCFRLEMLDMHPSPERSVESVGLSSVALLALIFQFSNLRCH
eukprot:5294721-Amphidinium_carterae.1